jgi:hypothetical protein
MGGPSNSTETLALGRRGLHGVGVTPALVWVPLAASFVIGLAAVIRMATPESVSGDTMTGAIRLPQALTATIATLFALAALVVLVDLVRRAVSRRREEDDEAALGPEPPRIPAWLRTLTQILTLAYFVAVAYLLWRGAIPLVDMLAQRGAGAALGDPAAPPGPGAPPIVTWTFGALALAVALGALALALWLAFGERVGAWWQGTPPEEPPEPLAAAVEESLDDLRAESDPRRAIIRCYARFERVASDVGVARHPWLTPMEFMREALGRLPVPRAAVPVLTGLFERARFSHHPLGAPERDRALAALDEIRMAIERRDGDAPAA